jgi:hypothetical protein
VGRLNSGRINVARLDSDNAKAGDVPSGRLYKGSLGAIIGQFKSVCTKRISAVGHDFAWQTRFYDEIIHDEKSLGTIREYIRNNPMKWDLDKDNPSNHSK